ncbi:glycosyltransferase family 4 protein [Motilimonas sp. KMU-193]|uniref:glycosyltransferase family 4 protein n=1 Tax=Motilimonas sp. KMU-193 TaxID=3388668 RepID=UPI00396B34AD
MEQKKLKILVCASYKHAWNSIRPEAELFVGLAQMGHDITVMTQGEAEYCKRLEEHGIKVVDCYPKRKICFDTIAKIRRELSAHDYDICYAFNSKTIPNAGFACIGFKVKFIVYRGTTGGLYRHDPSAYLTILHPRVDAVVCVSKAVQEDVQSKVWRNKDKVITIYKGHSLDWYKVAPTDRSTLGLKETDIVGICAAHVRPSKGIDVLLAATNEISNPNFHLLLAGHGFEPHFAAMKNSKMSDRIHFLGHRSDVPSLMAMADVQLQPSISGEGLPRTIIEAMANGTPSIVTTTGGAPELIEQGVTGVIIPPKDSLALATAINQLTKDKTQLDKMGQQAKQRLAEKFSSEVTIAQHLNFFYQLLGE